MTPAEILRLAFQLNLTQHVSSITDPSELARARAIEAMYTAIVDNLRGPTCRSPLIRSMAAELWDVVAGKKVRTVIFEAVESIAFSVYKGVATIVIPPTWLTAMSEDPVLVVGGVVATGSQAVSWHKLGRVDPDSLRDRAQAYEAEFLVTIFRADPHYRFNVYQRQVLGKYPLGLASFQH
jgi:hypothetical protein